MKRETEICSDIDFVTADNTNMVNPIPLTMYSTMHYARMDNTEDNPVDTANVSVPANSTTSFEFITMLGGGLGGLNHSIVIE